MSKVNDLDASLFCAFQGTVPKNVSDSNQSWNISISISQPVGGQIEVWETEPDWDNGVWIRHYKGTRIGELILQSEEFLPFQLNRYSWVNINPSTKEGLRRFLRL